MRRTLQDARSALGAATPNLNPEMYGRMSDELRQAEAEAVRIAEDYAQERANGLVSLRDELLEEACGIRDDYAALIAQGELGEVDSRDFQDRYEVLEHRKRRLARRQGDLDSVIAVVERIEADPAGWTDAAFYSKYHQLMPDFSF